MFGGGNLSGSAMSGAFSGSAVTAVSQHANSACALTGSKLTTAWPAASTAMFGGSTTSVFGLTSGNFSATSLTSQPTTFGSTAGVATFASAAPPTFQFPGSSAASASSQGKMASFSTAASATTTAGLGLFVPPASALRSRQETG
jgi:hypothetical protein